MPPKQEPRFEYAGRPIHNPWQAGGKHISNYTIRGIWWAGLLCARYLWYIDTSDLHKYEGFFIGVAARHREKSETMAEEKSRKRLVKQESMRDRAAKASSRSEKPRRLKKTASAIRKPFAAAHRIGKKEYYVIKPHESGFKGFLTKKRRWTPGYFRSSFKELRLVTWPNRKETWKLVVSVFLFSIIFGCAIAIVDYGLDKLFKEAFL